MAWYKSDFKSKFSPSRFSSETSFFPTDSTYVHLQFHLAASQEFVTGNFSKIPYIQISPRILEVSNELVWLLK